MRIYQLENEDVDQYCYFLPARDSDADSMEMDCTPRQRNWQPPRVILYGEKGSKMGDFLQFTTDALIVSPKASRVLRPFFEAAGELLPLRYKGVTYHLVNITQCVDCLDPSSPSVLLPVLVPHLLPATHLFKLPQTDTTAIYLIEGRSKSEEEFRRAVESNGLTGLAFYEVWSDA
jgi:hypothetical protein